jgi:hypothetical protein
VAIEDVARGLRLALGPLLVDDETLMDSAAVFWRDRVCYAGRMVGLRSSVALAAALLACGCSDGTIASSGTASVSGVPSIAFGLSAPSGTKIRSVVSQGEEGAGSATLSFYADAPGIGCGTLTGFPLAVLSIAPTGENTDPAAVVNASSLVGRTISFGGTSIDGTEVGATLYVYDYVSADAGADAGASAVNAAYERWLTNDLTWTASSGSVTFSAADASGLSGTFTATIEPFAASGRVTISGTFDAPNCND